MPDVFVSLGSNLDPVDHIRGALSDLEQALGALRQSPIYRNAAVGFEGPPFLNLVVGATTGLSLAAVRQRLRDIEDRHQRRRDTPRYASRSLDLDLLLYGDTVIAQDGLQLPRPDILEQAFVLRPLADLIGERRHPLTRRSYATHWAEMDASAPALEAVSLPVAAAGPRPR